ncbi:MAG TPA: DUF2971 domain-containing protein [Bacteroidales bacterium]|nr:DUF2971 domain-containing protein [Bacteroidales bacterium]
MIEYESDHNRFIYHYTKLETAEKYILANGTIRLSQYTKTNDPKESSDWKFDLGTNKNADLGKYSREELSKWLSNELKQKTKLACFSKDNSGLDGNNLTDLFKRGYIKPRMWAQYAKNHHGVCLVIDRSKFIKEVKTQVNNEHKIMCGDVEYLNENPIPDRTKQHFLINIDTLESVGKKNYAAQHLYTYYKELFFQKMLDWKDESEWRCLVFTSDKNDLYIDLNNSLMGIIHGEGLNDDEISRLMSLSNKYDLSHLAIKWRNATPWYDYSNPLFWESG